MFSVLDGVVFHQFWVIQVFLQVTDMLDDMVCFGFKTIRSLTPCKGMRKL